MKFLFFLCISLLSLTVWSQEEISVPPPPEKMVQEPEIVEFPDKEPKFPGEMEAFKTYIKANLVYPKTALENNITGRCYIGMVVEIDGSISNVKVLRGLPGCPECDKEAIRLIKAMPNWIPGETAGKVVRTRFHLPVKFG